MRRFFICTLMSLFVALCFAGGRTDNSRKAPLWLTDMEGAYPSAKYIRAMGEGASARQAQNDALSEISLYFNTKTEILSVAIKEAQSVLQGDEETFSQSQGFSQMVNVSSNADFFCVRFADSYYDKKRDTFYALAYIDKAEVSSIYRSRISFLLESIASYKSLAQKEGELFRAAGYLHKANVLSSLATQYIQNLVTVVPSESPKYADSLSMLAHIPEELGKLKQNMSFSINIIQKEQLYNPLFATISDILEEQGFVYAVKDARYIISLDISCIEEKYQAGDFVRPSVSLVVLDKNAKSMYSYTKTYPRVSGSSLAHSYTRAVSKIQSDFRENLFAEYR